MEIGDMYAAVSAWLEQEILPSGTYGDGSIIEMRAVQYFIVADNGGGDNRWQQ